MHKKMRSFSTKQYKVKSNQETRIKIKSVDLDILMNTHKYNFICANKIPQPCSKEVQFYYAENWIK